MRGRNTAVTAATALLAIGLLAASSSLAQSGRRGPRDAPRCDVTTETTVTGVVEAVVDRSSPRGRAGRHVTLAHDGERIDVHLGPAWFLDEQDCELTAGEAIAVTGSRTTVDDRPVVIARELRMGQRSITLRNRSGIPAWSRGRRR